jgi:hypothetical protein
MKQTHLIDFNHSTIGPGPSPSLGRVTVHGNPYNGATDTLEIFNGRSRYLVETKTNLIKLRDALIAAYPLDTK